MKKTAIAIAIFSILLSCNSKTDKKVLRKANGKTNYALIVCKASNWQGSVGDALRKIISEPVLGLPQPEAQFDISQIPPKNYNSMFRASRNILIVGIGEENGYKVETDVYARPQKIMTILGTNEKELIKQINQHKKDIITVFKNADIKSIQKRNSKSLIDKSTIKVFKKHGFTLDIPRHYRMVENIDDMAWYRHRLSGGNSVELFAYTLPITSEKDENGQNIVTARNEFGKKYIPGEAEGSYMITEEAYTPHTFKINLANRKTFETKGKWEVKGVYMAGPFLNYTVVDKPNNRLIVVEGMVYAPSKNKRDFIFDAEAILKTLKIN